MKNACLAIVVVAFVPLVFSGCKKEVSAEVELERAVQTMEAAEVQAPAPEPMPVAQPAHDQPVQTAPPPAQQLSAAMAAYKGGEYVDAVTRLQTMRAQAAMSPQQRMALQDAMAAVMTEIYTLAAQGDARAQEAVKEYERRQNMR